MRIRTQIEGMRTSSTSEISGQETSERQRYAHTDENEGSVFTVETAILEFWCALYCLSISNSAFSLTIKEKYIKSGKAFKGKTRILI